MDTRVLPGNKTISRFSSMKELVSYATGRFIQTAQERIRSQGRFSCVFSGGKTPVALYFELAKNTGTFWNKTHIFLADDRVVAEDHPDSNFGMIKRALQNVLPAGHIHPAQMPAKTPIRLAEEYQCHLKGFFPGSRLPDFDLTLLGIGPDGHTASLFPGSNDLMEVTKWVIPTCSTDNPHQRITLTMPTLLGSKEIWILATGSKKAHIVSRVLEEKSLTIPASIAWHQANKAEFLVDNESCPTV